MIRENSPIRPAIRVVSTVGGFLLRVLGAVLVAVYLVMWLALAGVHVFRADFLAAAISLVVFVAPVVVALLWSRLKAYDLRRNDPDVDVGSPAP
jgi:hypothetical protein